MGEGWGGSIPPDNTLNSIYDSSHSFGHGDGPRVIRYHEWVLRELWVMGMGCHFEKRCKFKSCSHKFLLLFGFLSGSKAKRCIVLLSPDTFSDHSGSL